MNSKTDINSIETILNERFSTKISISTIHETTILIDTDTDTLLDLANFIKDELEYLRPVCGTSVDKETKLEMLYHIGSIDNSILIEIRITLDRDEPVMPSLTPIWLGFDWHEREAFDLMGIIFEGHPNLRRLFMLDDWEGHPLRKDYEFIPKESLYL